MEEQEVEENPPVRPYKSLHSFVESPVRFINRTGREVHVIWINYEGKEVLKTTLLTNKKLDLNTFMTHPWIAVDAKTNERMLLNFRKTYLPGEPEVRRMDFENRKAYVARAQVLITLPVCKLEEYCVKTLKNIVSPQDIHKLPLPPLILEKISRTSS
ncbi:unnamed protein product [Porites lobata]|uniref:von Hippel-Lindau disease tumour suppressor beta domain-containing protein n=1 Tax=Porites lobata TaxID=104759 RepID=A0ABN8QQY9_9CNID|nr:unnamed protein product [Porites lobata]